MATYRIKRFGDGEVQKAPSTPAAQPKASSQSVQKAPSIAQQQNLKLKQQGLQVSSQRNQLAQTNIALRQQGLQVSSQRNAIASARLQTSQKQKAMAGMQQARAQANLVNKPNMAKLQLSTKPVKPVKMPN